MFPSHPTNCGLPGTNSWTLATQSASTAPSGLPDLGLLLLHLIENEDEVAVIIGNSIKGPQLFEDLPVFLAISTLSSLEQASQLVDPFGRRLPPRHI